MLRIRKYFLEKSVCHLKNKKPSINHIDLPEKIENVIIVGSAAIGCGIGVSSNTEFPQGGAVIGTYLGGMAGSITAIAMESVRKNPRLLLSGGAFITGSIFVKKICDASQDRKYPKHVDNAKVIPSSESPKP